MGNIIEKYESFLCLFIRRFDYRKRLMFSVVTVLCDGQGGRLLIGFVY